jgi:hypothetical protein
MRLPERLAASPLAVFFVKGALWLVLLTALWAPLADWTMRPAATLATAALQTAFPWWARGGEYKGDTLELSTRIEMPVANAPLGSRAELVAEAKPAHYGFGLPMLLALLLASGGRRLARKLAIGVGVLIPCQAFSIFFVLLKQVALGSGPAATAQLALSALQLNGIALAYQLGVLLLPTLVPIVLWLLLERTFLAAVMLEGELRRSG